MNEPGSLVLASGSPRRKELFSALGWPFRVSVPCIPEDFLPGEGAREASIRLSRRKAEAVAAECGDGAWVVAADTVVSSGGFILGKPVSREHSMEMLRFLNGSTHLVITGVTVVAGETTLSAAEETSVTFRKISEDDLAAYVESGEGDDKAGSYAIQGRGSLLVSSICGDYFNVVGLPLYRLSSMFESLGYSLREQWRKCS